MSYAVWDAAIAAGATIDELKKLDDGGYPPMFVAKVVAWRAISNAVGNNVQDAVAAKAAKKK
jgi:hypothetical protein